MPLGGTQQAGGVARVHRSHVARFDQRFQGAATVDTKGAMQLIMYYLVFMVLGDLGAYFIGLATERAFGSQVSLITFLLLYFLFLWVAWVLAVRLTEPKGAKTAQETAQETA